MAAGEKPLRCQEVLQRLKQFGIVEHRQRGSHIILLKPEHSGSDRGPTYPLPCHNRNVEVPLRTIKATIRKLGIDEDRFWAL